MRLGDPPAARTDSLRRPPRGTSYTPGRSTAPDMVTSMLPGSSGQEGAVEDEMGRGAEQEVVLAAGRLSLGPVHHHHRTAAARAHRPHLPAGGEAGAAPPVESGPLDGDEEVVAPTAQAGRCR